MIQYPRKAVVGSECSECLDYRRFQAPYLHPCVTSETLHEYKVGMFSSDSDEYVEEFGFEEDAHGA